MGRNNSGGSGGGGGKEFRDFNTGKHHTIRSWTEKSGPRRYGDIASYILFFYVLLNKKRPQNLI